MTYRAAIIDDAAVDLPLIGEDIGEVVEAQRIPFEDRVGLAEVHLRRLQVAFVQRIRGRLDFGHPCLPALGIDVILALGGPFFRALERRIRARHVLRQQIVAAEEIPDGRVLRLAFGDCLVQHPVGIAKIGCPLVRSLGLSRILEIELRAVHQKMLGVQLARRRNPQTGLRLCLHRCEPQRSADTDHYGQPFHHFSLGCLGFRREATSPRAASAAT